MGVLHDLGYEVKNANGLQQIMQAVASSRPGAWMFSKTIHQQDKVLFKATGGRLTVPSVLAGLPVVMVTTTGAKTGQSQTMPLLGIPVGDNLAVIGSNYGQKSTPGWGFNLEADRVFELAGAVYPGYAKYRIRADHRVIKVFVLESAN